MSASSRATRSTVQADHAWFLRAVRLWWERLPTRVARVAPVLGNALTDGLHYVHWPAAAALAPPLSLVLGGVLSWLHPEEAFTSWPALLVIFTVVGMASVQLGAWVWVGFTTVELVEMAQPSLTFGSGPLAGLGRVLAVVDESMLLALLTIGVPTAVLAIRLSYRGLTPPALHRVPVEALVCLAAAAASTYIWAQSAVVLVRPVFTLQGMSPTVAAVASVQEGWPLVVGAGLVASGGRLILEHRAARSPAFLRSTAHVAAAMSRDAGTLRPPAAVRIVLAAAAGTLLLSGLVTTYLQAALTFAVLVLLEMLGSRLSARGQPRMIAAVPMLVRLVLLVPVLYLVTRVVLGFASTSGTWTSDSFVAPWLSVLLCTAASVLVLSPVVRKPTSAPTRRTDR